MLGSTTTELRENALPYLAVVGDGTAWPLEWSLLVSDAKWLRRNIAYDDLVLYLVRHWTEQAGHAPLLWLD